MSRIGKKPIELPPGVSVDIQSDKLVIKGGKGEMSSAVPLGISFEQEDTSLVAKRADESKQTRAFHGLARSLAANAVHGVSEGFVIDLEIHGIGYRAATTGKTLTMQLGFSHAVEFAVPEGVSIDAPEPTKIRVEGIDKQWVGEIAARIRRFRPPDAYKGKGIRYSGELVRTKVGKAAAAT